MEALTFYFDSKEALGAALIPFAKKTSLFLNVQHVYELGSILPLRIKITTFPEQQIEGKVIWISSSSAPTDNFFEIGVEIGHENHALTKIIDDLLIESPIPLIHSKDYYAC